MKARRCDALQAAAGIRALTHVALRVRSDRKSDISSDKGRVGWGRLQKELDLAVVDLDEPSLKIPLSPGPFFARSVQGLIFFGRVYAEGRFTQYVYVRVQRIRLRLLPVCGSGGCVPVCGSHFRDDAACRSLRSPGGLGRIGVPDCV